MFGYMENERTYQVKQLKKAHKFWRSIYHTYFEPTYRGGLLSENLKLSKQL